MLSWHYSQGLWFAVPFLRPSPHMLKHIRNIMFVRFDSVRTSNIWNEEALDVVMTPPRSCVGNREDEGDELKRRA